MRKKIGSSILSLSLALVVAAGASSWPGKEANAAVGTLTVNLSETSEAFKNPNMGFRPSVYIGSNNFPDKEYTSIYKHYIPYTSLENLASDSVQKIKDWSNTAWAGLENRNLKVVPRVVIVYPNVGEYWPDGIPHGDPATQWTSETYKNRMVAFINKLGQAWNNDPRVAAIEFGLFGNWGEQHIWPAKFADGTDRIPLSFQQALGDAYVSAFPNKKVMVRYPDTFVNYPFGIQWDSFALPDDASGGNGEIARDTWRTQINSGEVAYDWGDQSNLGGSPDGTLGNVNNTNYVIDWIMKTHTSSLGWIAEYNAGNSASAAGATSMQKVLGYRYVINQASYSGNVSQGGTMNVSFNVVNKGSSPFYYNWPVEASLLRADKTVAWKGLFNADIRQWLPGTDWNAGTRTYNNAPATNTVNGSFTIPSGLANGTYTLALAILDPSGWKPSVRFANANYYAGGRTPIGKVGIGGDPSDQNLGSFSSLKSDNTLTYSLTSGAYDGGVSGGGGSDTQAPSIPSGLSSSGVTSSSVSLSWNASTDNVGVTGYDVYRGGTLVGSTASTSYTNTGLAASTSYTFTVRAKDAAGNVSAASSPLTATTSASGGGGGTTTTYEAEASGNTLAGGAAVSSCGSCSGGSKVGYVGNNGGTLQFNGVNAASAGTATITVSYLNGDATRSAQLSVNGGSAVTLNFPNTGGWTTVGTVQTQVALAAGVNTIKLSNPSGWAPDFDRIQVATSGGGGGSDTQAPSVPNGLNVTGKTSTSISLSWNAASDNVGVTGYDVYRGGTLVGSTGTTSYTSTGLAASTSYTFTVRAKDAAGNVSASSSSITDATSASGGGGTGLLLDNFDGSPSWPGSNDLGKWAGANSFSNGSGVIESGALKLQYSNNGWLGTDVTQSITGYTKMIVRVKGANGGEQSHFKLSLGGVEKTLADFSGNTVTTAYKDIEIDLVANGVNRSAPGQLTMTFWHGGSGTIWIDEIRFV
ncbi:fibronectin type III domain-containing protein [Cohnella sp. GCM10027633]|uniref:fibronectin type III domain-containing protein n=1 Tax=unclassified Cohnella TaxID=2636738 RepID=UPI00363C320B